MNENENDPEQLITGEDFNLNEFETNNNRNRKILTAISVIGGITLFVIGIILAITLTVNGGKNKDKEQKTDKSDDISEETSCEEYYEEENNYENDYEENHSEETTYEENHREEMNYEEGLEEESGYEERYEESNHEESGYEETYEESNHEESCKEEEEEIPIILYGNLRGTYDIKSGEINILSDEFEGDENSINIYIGDKKIDFTKRYNFNSDDPKTVRFEIISEDFSMENMFKNVQNLSTIEFSSINSGKITSLESTFENCVSLLKINFEPGWDTSELISMKKTFASCKSLNEVDFGNLNLSNVKDMSHMFKDSNLLYFTPDKLDLDSIETMNSMFQNCKYLIL